jgi:hypothetical protein
MSAIPTQPSIREDDEYCPMDLSGLKVSALDSTPASAPNLVNPFENKSLSLSSPPTNSLTSPTNEVDDYMSMNPATQSFPASEESGYLSMIPTARSSASAGIDQGYLNMAPQGSSRVRSSGGKGSSSGHSSHHRVQSPPPPKESLEKLSSEFPLAPVKSFFSPAEEPADLIKPVRAYSIGSRPISSKTLFGRTNLLPTSLEDPSKGDNERIRAFSMGCQGTTALREKLKERIKPTVEQVLGTIEQLDETSKDKKSSSTPALQVTSHRVRSSTVGCRPTASQVSSSKQLVPPSKEPADHMLLDYSGASPARGEERKLMFRTRTNTRSSTASNPESRPRSPKISTPMISSESKTCPIKRSQDLDYAEIDFNQSDSS